MQHENKQTSRRNFEDYNYVNSNSYTTALIYYSLFNYQFLFLLQVWVESNCDCKFRWCCEVKCKLCRNEVKQHFCRAKKKRKRRKNRRRYKDLSRRNRNLSRYIMRDQPRFLSKEKLFKELQKYGQCLPSTGMVHI